MTEPTIDWIRVSTAAKLRGIKRQNVYYHIAQGHLTVKDMDGYTLVSRDEVDKLKLKRKLKGET